MLIILAAFRELENFQGTIILTTNLSSTIDATFLSRVNIHLLFEQPLISSRRILWGKCLARVSAYELNEKIVGEEILDELVKWDLNGREIRDSVTIAMTWCVGKGFELDLSRLESAIKVTAPESRKITQLQDLW
jgi:hypothetical protein